MTLSRSARRWSAATAGWPRQPPPGERVTDCGPGETCFGAAAYDDAAGLPEGALRASLGCGNPLAVAALNPGETVLDLGIRRRYRRAAVGPAGRPVRPGLRA